MMIRQVERFRWASCAWAAMLLAGVGVFADDVAPNGQGGKMLLEDEPAWNGAEEAAGAGQWDSAVDGYLKTLRTTGKPWLKTRAAGRILEVGPKAQRYEAVITAYLSLVHTDPAGAAPRRPVLPEKDSSYIDTALAATEQVLGEANLTGEQRQSVLALQLDLYRIRKDDAKAGEVLGQLNQFAANSTGPDAARRFADMKLSTAKVALDRDDPAGAIAAVNAARGALNDPGQQEEGLYLLARAMEMRGEGSPGGLKDAGIAYMRVVAHFQDWPGNRHVAEALERTGGILEKLKETKIAADLYEQAAIQYDTRPEAQKARDHARRLRASGQGK